MRTCDKPAPLERRARPNPLQLRALTEPLPIPCERRYPAPGALFGDLCRPAEYALDQPRRMRIDPNFLDRYRALEARMRALAEAHGETFLPNLEPVGPADYVLVCMEPSLGRWARSAAEAKIKIDRGFRNFVSSLEDFILHFCARRYLCSPGERYHVTDLAKGAMLVAEAGATQADRYGRWYPLLREEMDIVSAHNAVVIAVGKKVADQLERNRLPRSFTRVIHYSGQAARARRAAIVGCEAEFNEFRRSVSLTAVLREAELVLEQVALPQEYRVATLEKLASSNLSESRRQLMFHYKTEFETLRSRRVIGGAV